MSYQIYFQPEVEMDIKEATLWYEKQCKGLGDDFLYEIQDTLDSISDNPYLYAVVGYQLKAGHFYKITYPPRSHAAHGNETRS